MNVSLQNKKHYKIQSKVEARELIVICNSCHICIIELIQTPIPLFPDPSSRPNPFDISNKPYSVAQKVRHNRFSQFLLWKICNKVMVTTCERNSKILATQQCENTRYRARELRTRTHEVRTILGPYPRVK